MYDIPKYIKIYSDAFFFIILCFFFYICYITMERYENIYCSRNYKKVYIYFIKSDIDRHAPRGNYNFPTIIKKRLIRKCYERIKT